jgi:hypothetical protein
MFGWQPCLHTGFAEVEIVPEAIEAIITCVFQFISFVNAVFSITCKKDWSSV